MSLTLPSDRIDPICDALESGGGERKAAELIAEEIDLHPEISGRSPTCVAAACIYVAGHTVTYADGTRPTQGEIADAADVGESSIRAIYPIVADAVDAELTDGTLRVNQVDR